MTTMVGLLILLPGCGGGPTDAPAIEAKPYRTAMPAKPALAADVIAFRLKRDECDQFRGEEPTGPARAAFLTNATERTCKGSDAALRALRRRHANDPAAIAALAGYDDAIE